MSQDNQDYSTNNLLLYANSLEQLLLNYAKYDVLRRKTYERKIQNLAQLSIDKGVDIDDIIKEINQEKKNEKLKEKIKNNIEKETIKEKEKEKNIKELEIKKITNQIFCEDFYNNLNLYLKRKKESLKINNLFNNNNKNNYGNNNVNNKYKMEQNNIYDSKKNNIHTPTETPKSNSKYIGKKRKSK